MHHDPIIKGVETKGESGSRNVINPFSGAIVGSVGYASASQMGMAVEAAGIAFELTRKQPSYERAQVLERTADGIKAREEELAQVITAESGKPIRSARIEVARAVFTFKSAAEAALHAREGKVLDMTVHPNGANRRGSYQYFPMGVVAAITPFNFPLNLVAHKVAPAIAAGNTVVLKPAPQTPLTSFLLHDILKSAGLADGVLNVVPCENDVAELLVRNERVRMLSFTGSAAVGWKLKSIAGRAKVTLELGGNGTVIVDEVVDWEKLIATLTNAAFSYAGQICIKLQNLLVRANLFDEMLERMIRAAEAVVVGDPIDERTVSGPMIAESPAWKVESWIASAVQKGAKRHTGHFKEPNWIHPTILTDVPLVEDIWQEEAFAPILNIRPYDDFQDALNIANSGRYGLQTSLFSKDSGKIRMAYEKLEVGAVIINDTNNYRLDTMPYGGVKESGFGREGVHFAMREMSEMKLLVETT